MLIWQWRSWSARSASVSFPDLAAWPKMLFFLWWLLPWEMDVD